MVNIFSSLGLLKTKEEWCGNGCAMACIKALSNYLLTFGVTPHCTIENYNQASMRLFEKLGFAKTHDCSFIIYSPTNEIQ